MPIGHSKARAFKVTLFAFLWRFSTEHFRMCPQKATFRRGIYTCPAKNYNKDDLWKFSCISFSCTAIFKNKILQKIATKTTFGNRFVCFSTFSNVSWRRLHKRMQSHISCICLTFYCRTISSAAIPTKNWNCSCLAAILFPVRQIHDDNLGWQQRRMPHNMFSSKELQQRRLFETGLFINCRTGNRKTKPYLAFYVYLLSWTKTTFKWIWT